MSSYSTPKPPAPSDGDTGWEATRHLNNGPQTQLMRDAEDYLATAAHDIGRPVGPGLWELFVSCEPGDALQQQFEHMHPEFIAIHDVGTSSSRRLLAGLAAAASGLVHKLAIRRQGHGVPLATLEFVELPVTGSAPLRLYTTEVDADTHSRHQIARVLLAHSRLGAVMVGDLPAHALASALQPLQQAIASGPWPNRQLLMLPLASASTLATQAAQLAAGRAVEVRTTPLVTRPAQAWGFISASWNRLREQLAAQGVAVPAIGAAQTQGRRATDASAAAAPTLAPMAPLPLQPMPEIPGPGPKQAEGPSPLAAYVRQCGDIKGMVSCCVFELATQRPIAHAGSRPGPAMLASQGSALFAAMLESGRAMGLGHSPPDAAVTLASHHLLVRPLPNQPGMALHAVLDRSVANLTLVRLQLQRLDEVLDRPA